MCVIECAAISSFSACQALFSVFALALNRGTLAGNHSDHPTLGAAQMPSHVHIGGMQFLIMGLTILLWLFVFRVMEVVFKNNALGRGMAFIH